MFRLLLLVISFVMAACCWWQWFVRIGVLKESSESPCLFVLAIAATAAFLVTLVVNPERTAVTPRRWDFRDRNRFVGACRW